MCFGISGIERLEKRQIFKYMPILLSPTMKTFTAVLHKEEDMFVAECPEVGTTSQGKTIDDAVRNLKEAT